MPVLRAHPRAVRAGKGSMGRGAPLQCPESAGIRDAVQPLLEDAWPRPVVGGWAGRVRGLRPGAAVRYTVIVPRYAAIDIGSNSVRMEAAEVSPGQPVRILASEREVTRLGESVFRSGSVSDEALKATCAVLARMAGVYRKLDVVGVRAV